MNLPEGWPTREMINAGLATYMNTRKGVDAKDAMAQIFTDMYAAAPTPPAQEGYSKEWCLRKAELEGDQEIGAGRDSLIPPVQEDEPRAWMVPHIFNVSRNGEPYKKEVSYHPWHTGTKGRYVELDGVKHYDYPLFTHPANDGLRKAAEEALYCLRLMAEFHFRGKSESAECHRLADNLLDALEGK